MRTIRTKRIDIDLPTAGDVPWISSRFQVLERDADGNVLAVHDDQERMVRRLDRVAVQTVTVIDPVTQQPITASVAGMAGLIRAAQFKWMAEDFGATYDADLDAMVMPE